MKLIQNQCYDNPVRWTTLLLPFQKWNSLIVSYDATKGHTIAAILDLMIGSLANSKIYHVLYTLLVSGMRVLKAPEDFNTLFLTLHPTSTASDDPHDDTNALSHHTSYSAHHTQ